MYWLLWDIGKSHSFSSAKYRTGKILSLPEVEHLPWTVLLCKVTCVLKEMRAWRGVEWCSPWRRGEVTGECDAASLSPEQPQLDCVPPLPSALISLLLRAQFSSWKTHLKNQPAKKKRSFFSRGLTPWPWLSAAAQTLVLVQLQES